MKFTSQTAVIGGSGLYQLAADDSSFSERFEVLTPYAEEPVVIFGEEINAQPVWFLPRHGKDHALPPHRINYRANIHALKSCGVKRIIAVNAVGGINPQMKSGSIVLPDQIIDYTWGREHSFFDGLSSLQDHIDFSWPYDRGLLDILEKHAEQLAHPIFRQATYACTQGPRLETSAEIKKLARDGCDIVGMTGMPEAALARELDLAYACIALVVNPAAGLSQETIKADDIKAILVSGMEDIRNILFTSLPALNAM